VGLNVRQQFPLMEWAQSILTDRPMAEPSDARPNTAPVGGPLPALKLKANCQSDRPSSVASTIFGNASTSRSARPSSTGSSTSCTASAIQSARPSSIGSSTCGSASALQSARSTAAGVTNGGLGGTQAELELDFEELQDSVQVQEQHEQEVPVRKATIAWGLESVEMLESPVTEAAAADPVGSDGLHDSKSKKEPEAGTEKKVESKPGSRSSRNGTSSKTVCRPRSTPLRQQRAKLEEVNRPVSVMDSLRTERCCGLKLRPSQCKGPSPGLKAMHIRGVHGTNMPSSTKVRNA